MVKLEMHILPPFSGSLKLLRPLDWVSGRAVSAKGAQERTFSLKIETMPDPDCRPAHTTWSSSAANTASEWWRSGQSVASTTDSSSWRRSWIFVEWAEVAGSTESSSCKSEKMTPASTTRELSPIESCLPLFIELVWRPSPARQQLEIKAKHALIFFEF